MVKFNNNEEFFEALVEKRKEVQQRMTSLGYRTLKNRNYAEIIAEIGDGFRTPEGFLMYNYDTHEVSRDAKFIKNCINVMQNGTLADNSPTVTRDVMYMLDSESNLKKPNPAPKGIRHFKNGAFNLKTKELIEDPGWTYYNVVPFNVKTLDDVDPVQLKIVKKIFNDWSDGNEEKERQIKELAFTVIEGLSRKKITFIMGPGGNGKSIFLEICSILAGNGGTIYCNLHQINDDNKLNHISPVTNFIMGDDLSTNAKLTGEKLSRFKQLISGSVIDLNVKFEKDVSVRNKAPFIQATNTDVDFYENNASISRRVHVIEWTNKLFKPEDEQFVTYVDAEGNEVKTIYDLKDLVDEIYTDFFEAFISYVVYTTDYPETLYETEKSKEKTMSMISETDQVAKFFNHFKEKGIFFNEYIPTQLIYASYKDFIKDENVGAKPLSNQNFNKRFKPMYEEIGFTRMNNNKRLKSYSIFEFNPYSLFQESDENEYFRNKTESYNKYVTNEAGKYLINENNHLDEDIISKMKNNIHTKNININNLSDKDVFNYLKIILDLCLNHKNTYLIGKILETPIIQESVDELKFISLDEARALLEILFK